MDTVAFIPVRGGSKSIPRKNIKLFAGRPLVHWVTRAALQCPLIDRVYVASEDPEIRAVAAQVEGEGLVVVGRDPATATDEATTESALLEFARRERFDRVVLIQATSPLLSADDLTGGLRELERTGADSLLSVTREHRFLWARGDDGAVRPMNYDPLARPRRQDWAGEIFENGAFYVTSREALLRSGCRLSGRVAAWEMATETAVELDRPEDWERAEALMAARGQGPELAARCARVRLLVCDVDGVLTDGGMYYGPEGEALKKFSTRDAHGLALFREAGGEVAIMTGENSPIVTARAAKLGLTRVDLGVRDKGRRLRELTAELGLDPSEVAFIGDDVNDLPALRLVGLAACPSDAQAENRAAAHYVCAAPGGAGCVRELVELLLRHGAARAR